MIGLKLVIKNVYLLSDSEISKSFIYKIVVLFEFKKASKKVT